MGNSPSKSSGNSGSGNSRSRRSTRTGGGSDEYAPGGGESAAGDTPYGADNGMEGPSTHHNHYQQQQQQQQQHGSPTSQMMADQTNRVKRLTLEGKMPIPITGKQLYNGHEISGTPMAGAALLQPPQPQYNGAQSLPGTPYMSGTGSALGTPSTVPTGSTITPRGNDYFPLQITSTRESRKSLGGRMRGRRKKAAAAAAAAAAGSETALGDDGSRTGAGGGGMPRSYCDLAGIPILTGGGGPRDRLPPLRETQSISLTEYVSIATGAEYAIIKHAEKPKQFSVDDMIFRLLEAGFSGKVTKSVCLRNSEIIAVCQAAREVFLAQPTLLQLAAPVKITGDIHGQYTDLLRLFDKCGYPPHCNYLFLGDYVDRGKQSLETMLLLMCFKIKYPDNFFLLRGNHECANVTRVYGFYDECKRRCNVKVWKAFINAFNALPVAAVVASKIFCVHGGLSPDLASMEQIRQLQRPCDVPDHGVLNDLLWSDPSDTAADWEDNERGVSYCFGKSIITDFLRRMDFDLICRAHMVVEDGYEFFHGRQLVTVFSAPNYCGEFDNSGAVMNVNEELLCSFEILKPLLENVQTCMARVEAGFWTRRQQVEAALNEAIAVQAMKEVDQQQQQQQQKQQQQQNPQQQQNQQQNQMEQHHRRQKHLTEALPKSSSSPSMAHRAPSTRTPHTSGSQPPGAARDAAAADSAPHTANSAPGLSDPRARNSSSGSSSSHLSPTVHPPSLVNGRISSPLSASQRRRPPLPDAGGRALGASPSPSPSPSLSASSSVSAAAATAATAAAPSAAQPMDIPKPPRSQRIVGTDEINKALEASVDDDDDEDDDDDDEDDDKNNNNMGSVRPESILHGTPPRSARIKHNIFGDGDSP